MDGFPSRAGGILVIGALCTPIIAIVWLCWGTGWGLAAWAVALPLALVPWGLAAGRRRIARRSRRRAARRPAAPSERREARPGERSESAAGMR